MPESRPLVTDAAGPLSEASLVVVCDAVVTDLAARGIDWSLVVVDRSAFTRSEAERVLVKLIRAAKLPRPAFNPSSKDSRATRSGGPSA